MRREVSWSKIPGPNPEHRSQQAPKLIKRKGCLKKPLFAFRCYLLNGRGIRCPSALFGASFSFGNLLIFFLESLRAKRLQRIQERSC